MEKQNILIRAVAGLLMLGSVGCIFSALFFTMSACFAEANHKEKACYVTMKRNMIATIIQLISGWCFDIETFTDTRQADTRQARQFFIAFFYISLLSDHAKTC